MTREEAQEIMRLYEQQKHADGDEYWQAIFGIKRIAFEVASRVLSEKKQ